MKTTTTKQKNFTMISDKLCRVPIKKISQTEKLYIAYILRYQANGNTLFASNKSIGEQLGIDGGSVKKLNNKMNKQYNFFSAIQDKKYDNGIEYSSSHTIKVDEKLLDEFLDNVSTFIKEKPKTQNKTLESTIPTQVIPEVQVEVMVPQNEDNEEITIKEPEVIKTESNLDTKKEAMRIRFQSDMKYAKDAPISPATFHSLTNDYFFNNFIDKSVNKYTGLFSNDFEAFWERVQTLKVLLSKEKELV